MRKIKFRAWVNNQMSDWDEMAFFPEAYTDHGHDGPKHVHISHVFSDFGNQGVTLMQYTCIKDIEGKEIYSGDIVELPILNDFGSFSKELGQVIWPVGHAGHCIVNLKNDQQRTDVSPQVRVIGNIYENADLLDEGTSTKTANQSAE